MKGFRKYTDRFDYTPPTKLVDRILADVMWMYSAYVVLLMVNGKWGSFAIANKPSDELVREIAKGVNQYLEKDLGKPKILTPFTAEMLMRGGTKIDHVKDIFPIIARKVGSEYRYNQVAKNGKLRIRFDSESASNIIVAGSYEPKEDVLSVGFNPALVERLLHNISTASDVPDIVQKTMKSVIEKTIKHVVVHEMIHAMQTYGSMKDMEDITKRRVVYDPMLSPVEFEPYISEISGRIVDRVRGGMEFKSAVSREVGTHPFFKALSRKDRKRYTEALKIVIATVRDDLKR